MWLTSLFVRRPTLVFVLLALIAVAGSIAWSTLVRQQYPNVSQPTVTVSVTYNGASPTVMRDSIVRPIEDQIAGQPDLQTLNSTIQGGQATDLRHLHDQLERQHRPGQRSEGDSGRQ